LAQEYEPVKERASGFWLLAINWLLFAVRRSPLAIRKFALSSCFFFAPLGL
jgi:hypothetical protein